MARIEKVPNEEKNASRITILESRLDELEEKLIKVLEETEVSDAN